MFSRLNGIALWRLVRPIESNQESPTLLPVRNVGNTSSTSGNWGDMSVRQVSKATIAPIALSRLYGLAILKLTCFATWMIEPYTSANFVITWLNVVRHITDMLEGSIRGANYDEFLRFIDSGIVCQKCGNSWEKFLRKRWKREKHFRSCRGFRFCPHCPFKSLRDDRFETHMRLHVDDGSVYKCEFCNFVTQCHGAYQRHFASTHDYQLLWLPIIGYMSRVIEISNTVTFGI